MHRRDQHTLRHDRSHLCGNWWIAPPAKRHHASTGSTRRLHNLMCLRGSSGPAWTPQWQTPHPPDMTVTGRFSRVIRFAPRSIPSDFRGQGRTEAVSLGQISARLPVLKAVRNRRVRQNVVSQRRVAISLNEIHAGERHRCDRHLNDELWDRRAPGGTIFAETLVTRGVTPFPRRRQQQDTR
jgi:hypothetical protein